MERKIIVTKDGSHSFAVPGLETTYHSLHGAMQESQHVFIGAGLNYFFEQPDPGATRIFEMGLGTGLNAFLTASEAEGQKRKVHYTAIEPFPVSLREARALNYPEHHVHGEIFLKIHESNWEEDVPLSQFFTLRKEQRELLRYSPAARFDLVYYDAFAPRSQPELWTREVFEKLFQWLEPGGMLVTYCSKGDVRRAMMAAGFAVKKMPGPPGKREMLRATRSG